MEIFEQVLNSNNMLGNADKIVKPDIIVFISFLEDLHQLLGKKG